MAIKIFGEKGITFQFVKNFLTTVSLKCFVQCKTVTGETKFNKISNRFFCIKLYKHHACIFCMASSSVELHW